jgi:hypothetical protein
MPVRKTVKAVYWAEQGNTGAGDQNGLELCGGDSAQIHGQSRLALLLTINRC